MRARITRHRADRAERLPALQVIEVPHRLAQAIHDHSEPQRLLVVDCLTLWLANWLMPVTGNAPPGDAVGEACREALCDALRQAPGPVLLVSNEIGMGITPLGAEARRYVDALGRLHQAVAALCVEVSLLVAGIEVPVKRGGM
jgi:adenosylcobinamide kinase/adenosylcobinamide-phosphate guanylyltransferase